MMSSTKCRLKLLSSTHKCTYKCTYNKSMNIFNNKWFMKRRGNDDRSRKCIIPREQVQEVKIGYE